MPSAICADARATSLTYKRMLRIAVLASHEGTTLQSIIDACEQGRIDGRVVAVLSNNSGSGALRRAAAAGIETFHLSSSTHSSGDSLDAAIRGALQRARADIIFLAGYMKRLGPRTLAAFPARILNTHPALLPSFKGWHSVRDALEYGVKVTGCTVFMVDAGTDTGPVIAQAAVPVRDDDDVPALHERVKVAERVLLVDTVGAMARGGWSVQGRKVKVGN